MMTALQVGPPGMARELGAFCSIFCQKAFFGESYEIDTRIGFLSPALPRKV